MVNENKEYIMDEMRDPGEITCQDVAKWIEKIYGNVWDEYANSFSHDYNKYVSIIETGPLVFCKFGSNEGIYLIIKDERNDKVAVVAKTLDESDVKWYECVHTIAGIGLELKKIWG